MLTEFALEELETRLEMVWVKCGDVYCCVERWYGCEWVDCGDVYCWTGSGW